MPSLTFKFEDMPVYEYKQIKDFREELKLIWGGYTSAPLLDHIKMYAVLLRPEELLKLEYLRVGKVRII